MAVYGIIKSGPNAGQRTRCEAQDPTTCRWHTDHREMSSADAKAFNEAVVEKQVAAEVEDQSSALHKRVREINSAASAPREAYGDEANEWFDETVTQQEADRMYQEKLVQPEGGALTANYEALNRNSLSRAGASNDPDADIEEIKDRQLEDAVSLDSTWGKVHAELTGSDGRLHMDDTDRINAATMISEEIKALKLSSRYASVDTASKVTPNVREASELLMTDAHQSGDYSGVSRLLDNDDIADSWVGTYAVQRDTPDEVLDKIPATAAIRSQRLSTERADLYASYADPTSKNYSSRYMDRLSAREGTESGSESAYEDYLRNTVSNANISPEAAYRTIRNANNDLLNHRGHIEPGSYGRLLDAAANNPNPKVVEGLRSLDADGLLGDRLGGVRAPAPAYAAIGHGDPGHDPEGIGDEPTADSYRIA